MAKEKKWDDSMYVRAYQLCADGARPKELAAGLGITMLTMQRWRQSKPQFLEAINSGREAFGLSATKQAGGSNELATFSEYVYHRLPEELQELWEKINALDTHELCTNRLDAMLEGHGARARQQLFIYAMIACNFDPSQAMRKCGIGLAHVRRWQREEPHFQELLDEIQYHKKNFFENALVKLVKRGDPSAVIFVNRTINRDRGYNEKVDVSVTSKADPNQIDIGKLPLALRLQLLEAMEEQRQLSGPPGDPNVIDALPSGSRKG